MRDGTLKRCIPDFDGYDPCQEIMTATPLPVIFIDFEYPLHQSMRVKFANPRGFSIDEFKQCIWDGYTELFLLNPSNFWGHNPNDLYLEGWDEISPGVFHLMMGS